jgi:hypothetical protein
MTCKLKNVECKANSCKLSFRKNYLDLVLTVVEFSHALDLGESDNITIFKTVSGLIESSDNSTIFVLENERYCEPSGHNLK